MFAGTQSSYGPSDMHWQRDYTGGTGGYGTYQSRYGSYAPSINTSYQYSPLQRQGSGYSAYNSMPSSPYGGMPSSPYGQMPGSPYGSVYDTNRSQESAFSKLYSQEYNYGATPARQPYASSLYPTQQTAYSPYSTSQAPRAQDQQASAYSPPSYGYQTMTPQSQMPRQMQSQSQLSPTQTYQQSQQMNQMATQQPAYPMAQYARGIPADNRAFRTTKPTIEYMPHKQHKAVQRSQSTTVYRGPASSNPSYSDADFAGNRSVRSIVGQQGSVRATSAMPHRGSDQSAASTMLQQGAANASQPRYQNLIQKKQQMQQYQQQMNPPPAKIGGPPATLAPARQPPPSTNATNAAIMNQIIRDPHRFQIQGALSDLGDADRQSVVSFTSMKSFQTVQPGRGKRFPPNRGATGKMVRPHAHAPPPQIAPLPRAVSYGSGEAGPSGVAKMQEFTSPPPSLPPPQYNQNKPAQVPSTTPSALSMQNSGMTESYTTYALPSSGPLNPSNAGSEKTSNAPIATRGQAEDVLELYTLLRHVLFLVEQKDCETDIIEKQLTEALLEAKGGHIQEKTGCTRPFFSSKRKVAKVRQLEAKFEDVEVEISISKQRRQELSKKIAEILPMVSAYNLNSVMMSNPPPSMQTPGLFQDVSIGDKMRMLGVSRLNTPEQMSGKIPSERYPVGVAVGQSDVYTLPNTHQNSGSDNSGDNYDSSDDKIGEKVEPSEDQSPQSDRYPQPRGMAPTLLPVQQMADSSHGAYRPGAGLGSMNLNGRGVYAQNGEDGDGEQLNSFNRSLSSLDGLLNSVNESEGLERIVEEPHTPMTHASNVQAGSMQEGSMQ